MPFWKLIAVGTSLCRAVDPPPPNGSSNENASSGNWQHPDTNADDQDFIPPMPQLRRSEFFIDGEQVHSHEHFYPVMSVHEPAAPPQH